MLKKHENIDSYRTVFDQSLTGFPAKAGFNEGLSAPQPDFLEGLKAAEFRPFPIGTIKGAIFYKDDPISVTLPHIAGEWKARGKNMVTTELQAAYDGAALVYARNQALAYLEKPDPPGHAAVRTFTSDGTLVNFYAHYAAPSADGKLEYHQHEYASINVKGTYQGHKDGYSGHQECPRSREGAVVRSDGPASGRVESALWHRRAGRR